MAKLTTKARKNLRVADFALPGKKAYPIEDLNHARDALSRVSEYGDDEEKAQVRAKVKKKFPTIGQLTGN
jgi:hypothetical protein